MIIISLFLVTFIRACKLLVSPILLENKLPSMIKRFAHPYLALRISIQFSHRIFSIVEKSLPKRKRKKKRNRFAPLPRRTEPIDASIIQHKKKESRNEGTISCPLIRKHSGSRRLLAGAWRRNEGNEPLSPFCTLVTDTTDGVEERVFTGATRPRFTVARNYGPIEGIPVSRRSV